MPVFRFAGAMRYTRWSCRPFGGRFEIDQLVQAVDREDALRQVGLCIHRDLEDILSQVNAINVAEVRVETDSLTEVPQGEAGGLWNPTRFGDDRLVPRHIELDG